jgi:23S rRNA pseudouridine2605 synthase
LSIRLQKFIASTGVASRRKAEDLIRDGRVFVNRKKVREMGTLVDPAKDIVVVDGQQLEQVQEFRYIAVYKPIGVISTRAQHPGEKTVYDIVPNSRDLVIAGRLDKDSEGLVLLTNDGELVNKLTHPRYQHEKEYEVTLSKSLAPVTIASLLRGVKLTEGNASFDKIEPVSEKTYHHVNTLVRVRMNKLKLDDLKPGESREVKRSEIIS